MFKKYIKLNGTLHKKVEKSTYIKYPNQDLFFCTCITSSLWPTLVPHPVNWRKDQAGNANSNTIKLMPQVIHC